MKKKTIKWLDHYSCAHTWAEVSELKEPPFECETTGYVVKEDKDYVWLAHTVSTTGEVMQVMAIVKKAIVKKRR